ncbi:hypothetical protein B7R25_12925 [Subtercola boreus]|uniref:Uncharacterized protein n=1 Tax=Subtercola boreus TaxID=120213 RepID=A0A3E0WAP8_9MICO|nr:hypothetical protein B7R24_12825 [Subtercola boreus]RFA19156.1 hypothetical protein B7R23_12805 [Subtercola boreus]RFA25618.1 hypothetical protein B7R25_12925 [Subtercola boreus]
MGPGARWAPGAGGATGGAPRDRFSDGDRTGTAECSAGSGRASGLASGDRSGGTDARSGRAHERFCRERPP